MLDLPLNEIIGIIGDDGAHIYAVLSNLYHPASICKSRALSPDRSCLMQFFPKICMAPGQPSWVTLSVHFALPLSAFSRQIYPGSSPTHVEYIDSGSWNTLNDTGKNRERWPRYISAVALVHRQRGVASTDNSTTLRFISVFARKPTGIHRVDKGKRNILEDTGNSQKIWLGYMRCRCSHVNSLLSLRQHYSAPPFYASPLVIYRLISQLDIG